MFLSLARHLFCSISVSVRLFLVVLRLNHRLGYEPGLLHYIYRLAALRTTVQVLPSLGTSYLTIVLSITLTALSQVSSASDTPSIALGAVSKAVHRVHAFVGPFPLGPKPRRSRPFVCSLAGCTWSCTCLSPSLTPCHLFRGPASS